MENLEFNTRWDGIFHGATYIFVLIGLFLLWRTAHRKHLYWSTKLLIGFMLLGFGIFNTVEGIIDHHVLGVHHVNETVPRDQWVMWDIGFTLSGVAMIAIGWLLLRAGKRETLAMIRAIPAGVMYALFSAALVAATFPIWRLWLFDFNPTLDDLLQLRCFGA